LEVIGGETYAQVDCTHLLYRVDQLMGAGEIAKEGSGIGQDFRASLEKEREFARDQEAWKNIDQSCEGGG
jgi:ribonuclease D